MCGGARWGLGGIIGIPGGGPIPGRTIFPMGAMLGFMGGGGPIPGLIIGGMFGGGPLGGGNPPGMDDWGNGAFCWGGGCIGAGWRGILATRYLGSRLRISSCAGKMCTQTKGVRYIWWGIIIDGLKKERVLLLSLGRRKKGGEKRKEGKEEEREK